MHRLGQVHSAMKNGIYVGLNQKYSFLSYTISSLKTHSSWFLKEDGFRHFDKASLINQMGNFDNENAISLK